jgi:retron-type reverse transcriptase
MRERYSCYDLVEIKGKNDIKKCIDFVHWELIMKSLEITIEMFTFRLSFFSPLGQFSHD